MSTILEKPAIIIVPGAWHGPDAFKPTADLLKLAGYQTIGIRLPSVGANPPLTSAEPDISAIQKSILEALDQEQDVVVVMHSYGGVPGTDAVEGLGKKDRLAKGKKAGVVRMVYMCAFAPPVGTHLLDLLGADEETFPPEGSWIRREGDSLYASRSEEIFYNDLSPTDAEQWIRRLQPHSYHTFNHRTRYPAYAHIPSTYILCTRDNAIPPPAQEAMIAACKIEAVERLDCGHSPFLSHPKWTADAIRRAAGEKGVGQPGWVESVGSMLQGAVGTVTEAWKNAGLPDLDKEQNVFRM